MLWSMVNLPSGTVTFAFSDIEGSTSLLKQLGDGEYATLLATHRRLVRDTFAAHEGQEIDTQGDAFFYSFPRARQAVAAAIEVQRAHVKASWPSGVDVRVRLGLHTGEPAVGDEGYTGLDVVRAARIAAVGIGGQVLLSDATRAIVADDLPDGVELRSLGEQRLKDIDRPEPLHELVIDEVPVRVTAPAQDDGDADEDIFPDLTGEDSGPIHAFANQARQTIEARVLASLQETLGPIMSGELGPPGPGVPRRQHRRGSSMADEIDKLQALRDRGALSEEQYARAVDRIVNADPPPER
jgi:class 3 adenylate cyclase